MEKNRIFTAALRIAFIEFQLFPYITFAFQATMSIEMGRLRFSLVVLRYKRQLLCDHPQSLPQSVKFL